MSWGLLWCICVHLCVHLLVHVRVRVCVCVCVCVYKATHKVFRDSSFFAPCVPLCSSVRVCIECVGTFLIVRCYALLCACIYLFIIFFFGIE